MSDYPAHAIREYWYFTLPLDGSEIEVMMVPHTRVTPERVNQWRMRGGCVETTVPEHDEMTRMWTPAQDPNSRRLNLIASMLFDQKIYGTVVIEYEYFVWLGDIPILYKSMENVMEMLTEYQQQASAEAAASHEGLADAVLNEMKLKAIIR